MELVVLVPRSNSSLLLLNHPSQKYQQAKIFHYKQSKMSTSRALAHPNPSTSDSPLRSRLFSPIPGTNEDNTRVHGFDIVRYVVCIHTNRKSVSCIRRPNVTEKHERAAYRGWEGRARYSNVMFCHHFPLLYYTNEQDTAVSKKI